MAAAPGSPHSRPYEDDDYTGLQDKMRSLKMRPNRGDQSGNQTTASDMDNDNAIGNVVDDTTSDFRYASGGRGPASIVSQTSRNSGDSLSRQSQFTSYRRGGADDRQSHQPHGMRRTSSMQSIAFSDTGSVQSYVTVGGTKRRYGQVSISDDQRIPVENIFGYKGIFVGNMELDVEEKEVHERFAKYGRIVSMRMFPGHQMACALISYTNPHSPCQAIQAYKGKYVADLCFEDRMLTVTFAHGDRQPRRITDGNRAWTSDQCFYWRTTGCDTTIRSCDRVHDMIAQGVDFRPWMKNVTY